MVDLRNLLSLINDVLGYVKKATGFLRLVAEFRATVKDLTVSAAGIASDNFAGITRCGGITQAPEQRSVPQLKEYMRNSGMDEQPSVEIPGGVYRSSVRGRKAVSGCAGELCQLCNLVRIANGKTGKLLCVR